MHVESIKRKQAVAGYLFLAPTYLIFAYVILFPIIITFFGTFFYVDRFELTWEWVGLENYVWVLEDKRFWTTLKNTITFVFFAVIGNVGLGLLTAVLLNRALPNWALYMFRLVFFLPVLVTISSIAFVWKFLYSTDFGLFNYYLAKGGIGPIHWLTDTNLAMVSIIIFDIWKWFGFYMIIFLAALQNVPRSLIEAAQIDGARPWSIFYRITLPIISPVIFFAATYATITGLQVFDSARVLTGGGPGDATRVTVMYMVDEAFGGGDISTGAAAAVVLLLVVSVIAVFQFVVGRRLVHE